MGFCRVVRFTLGAARADSRADSHERPWLRHTSQELAPVTEARATPNDLCGALSRAVTRSTLVGAVSTRLVVGDRAAARRLTLARTALRPTSGGRGVLSAANVPVAVGRRLVDAGGESNSWATANRRICPHRVAVDHAANVVCLSR